MGLKRRTGKREHVNLTLSKEVSEKIDEYADEYGMSRSFAVEIMCRKYLKDMVNGAHVLECMKMGGLDDDRN